MLRKLIRELMYFRLKSNKIFYNLFKMLGWENHEIQSYIDDIKKIVGSWDMVSMAPHRYGGTEFKLSKREIGHIHLNGLLDIPFPKKIKEQIIIENLASKHHIVPKSGWITFRIKSQADISNAIQLLRLSYLYGLLKLGSERHEEEILKELDELKISSSLASIFLDLNYRKKTEFLEEES